MLREPQHEREVLVRQGVPLTLRLSKGGRNTFFNGLLNTFHPSQSIRRTDHPAPAVVEDVHADHRGRDLPAAAPQADVLVPEQFRSFLVARNP